MCTHNQNSVSYSGAHQSFGDLHPLYCWLLNVWFVSLSHSPCTKKTVMTNDIMVVLIMAVFVSWVIAHFEADANILQLVDKH